MKIKIVSIFILLVVMVSMFSSCTDKSVHYSDIEDFELAFEEDKSVDKRVTKETLASFREQKVKEAEEYIKMGEKQAVYPPPEKD